MNVASLSAILKSAYRFPVWNADADALIAPDGSEVPLGGGSWDGVLAKGTITTDQKVMDLSVTWNNAAVAFTGIKANITDTASNAASLLMDLQVGGVSKFSLLKTGQLSLQDGSVSAPAIRWAGDTDSGIFRYDNARTCIAGNGAMGLLVSGTEHVIPSGSAYSFSTSPGASSPDLFLCRDAANTLALRNSTNAQTFNIYNTYTDASNYERGFMKWNSNVLEIGAEAAGTGTKRNLRLGAYGVSTYAYLDILSAAYITTISAKYGSGLHGDLQIGEAAAQSVYFLNTGAAPSPASMSAYYRGLKFGRSTVSAQIDFVTRVDDTATAAFSIIGNAANASATTNLVGGAITISAGNGASGSSGDAHGGNLNLSGGTGYGTGHHGYIVMSNLPTSSAGLPAGALWNNSGVLTVA